MNISGPAAVAKPEMLFYAPGDLTVTAIPQEKKEWVLSRVGTVGTVKSYAQIRLQTLAENEVSRQ